MERLTPYLPAQAEIDQAEARLTRSDAAQEKASFLRGEAYVELEQAKEHLSRVIDILRDGGAEHHHELPLEYTSFLDHVRFAESAFMSMGALVTTEGMA